MTTLFSTLDIATTLPDTPAIAQPDMAHSLGLVPSHWERRENGRLWLVYGDGSRLPYATAAQAERFEARNPGLALPITNSCK